MTDNIICTNRCALYCSNVSDIEIDNLKRQFCGVVVETQEELQSLSSDIILYLCGRIDLITTQLSHFKRYYIIEELSQGYTDINHLLPLGCVPLNIHNQGVFFPQAFDLSTDYFHQLAQAHHFQTLTESNKPGTALRKGIYLSEVITKENELYYHLLRCSSNLGGPTDNFRTIDNMIITRVTELCSPLFHQPAAFNHVLAQIYYNDEKKARIKAHSDKTKDMPAHALIAFVTFYDRPCSPSKSDRFDWSYRTTSVLTTLHFKLKPCVSDTQNLMKEFTVKLYPGSVFVIPLSTNRLYTHEIKPSVLPSEKIPVRLGYVVRCSNTQAKFVDGKCFIVDESGEHLLEPCAHEQEQALRDLYYLENTSAEVVHYPPTYFSMNNGDYLMPLK